MRDSALHLLAEITAEVRQRVLPATADDLEELERYAGREEDFIRDVLGYRPWPGQAATTRALLEHHYVTVRSCRKAGKTDNAARIVPAFMYCAPTVALTTAPGATQVKEVLWSKLRTAHANSRIPLPGKCDTMQLRISAERFAIGLSTNRPERFLGFHAGVENPEDVGPALSPEQIEKATEKVLRVAHDEKLRLLIVVDEPPGVEQFLFDALKGSMSGERVFVLLIGNPTLDIEDDHEFARSHRPGSRYHRIKISAEPRDDDPLDCDEEFIAPDWLVSQDWIEECRRDWQEGSALFKAYVLAQFCGVESERCIVNLAMLEAAEAAQQTSKQGAHMGVDLARGGKDLCVAALWVDGVKRAEHEWKTPDLMESAQMVEALMTRWAIDGKPIPAEHVHVDDTGLGGGVTDRLRQRGHYVDAQDFGKSATGEWKHLCGQLVFKNRRAELHWVFRRVLQEGLGHLPKKWARSWAEAQWPRYEDRPSPDGTAIIVEPKDDIRARHGKSPDHLDADLLAWSRGSQRVSFRRIASLRDL